MLSSDLVQATEAVSAVVEENTAATEEMAAGSTEVTKAIENIASVSEENSASVEEVSASAEEMSAQVEEVTASAQSLAKWRKDCSRLWPGSSSRMNSKCARRLYLPPNLPCTPSIRRSPTNGKNGHYESAVSTKHLQKV